MKYGGNAVQFLQTMFVSKYLSQDPFRRQYLKYQSLHDDGDITTYSTNEGQVSSSTMNHTSVKQFDPMTDSRCVEIATSPLS